MSFKSVAEFLDPRNGHRPTSAERRLIEATRVGDRCILWDTDVPSRPYIANEENRIRADLLRLLITGGSKDCGLHESGVWLEGGWIEGELDLSYCTGKGATVLDYCLFIDRPNLAQMTVPLLSLDNSSFPGLFAQGLHVADSLVLRSCTANGEIIVSGAIVGGQLDLSGAELNGGTDEQGISQ
jgi:hypothetical protein